MRAAKWDSVKLILRALLLGAFLVWVFMDDSSAQHPGRRVPLTVHLSDTNVLIVVSVNEFDCSMTGWRVTYVEDAGGSGPIPKQPVLRSLYASEIIYSTGDFMTLVDEITPANSLCIFTNGFEG
jgi:hypothetical protein